MKQTVEQAFLRDILANPAENTPRCVYADWLEEHGRQAEAVLQRLAAMRWEWARLWPNAVLCYVEDGQAFFTTQSLEKQWGDDWNDAPWEHNAGRPYGPYKGRKGDYLKDGTPAWRIVSVLFRDTRYERPGAYGTNSPYSVEDINAGRVPWLQEYFSDDPLPPIMAGTSLPDFCSLIEQAEGFWWPNPREA